MSGSFVTGLLVGLLAGGALGTFFVAIVTVGSFRRLSGNRQDSWWAARAERASAHAWAESSMRIDLLLGIDDASHYLDLPIADVDDFEREMRELVRRDGMPSGG